MKLRLTKLLIFLAALVPLARLLWRFRHNALGANPVEVITHSTGDWTLILIMLTLSITPLRKLTKQYWLIGVRRMIGLFAFFYGCLHFTTYLWLDKFFDVHEMIKDIVKRPFITVGFLAFVCMIPLAITSTQGSIRRLGKNWLRLHRLIYVTALAGVIHYIWLVKADIRKPLQYAFVLGVLMTYRIVAWISEARKIPASVRTPSPEVTKV
ncbi:MAG TPA: protein-methionine-sulfoxide reductase heme-binding subunit MsrQ [Terriglobales bacterium]|jgi:sulfoxide reductase heme-binding subunit YedZ|nr:protein-methionine-sulfoxide reductase heme-binding subunit MsrQ [Terriglobales bacterium]